MKKEVRGDGTVNGVPNSIFAGRLTGRRTEGDWGAAVVAIVDDEEIPPIPIPVALFADPSLNGV